MAVSLLTVRIAANPPDRLDKALARDVPEDASLSRSRLARLILQGQVRQNGELVADTSARVAEGDLFEIELPEPEPSHVAGEAIPLAVAYEDDALIVVEKPAGMVVHPAPGSPAHTLVNALIAHCGASLSGIGGERRPGIVHRIDKDTSGLLVVAKSDRAHHGLADQFAAHAVERRYLAVCHGAPDAADPRLAGLPGVSFEAGGVIRIGTALDRHRTDRQRQAVVIGRGRHAVTRLKVLDRYASPPAAALVACWLETGRTHQIRVHMAHIGHGLIGDPIYGRRRAISARVAGADAARAAADFPRQALHAATLGFAHPITGETLRFEAPLPDDMVRLIRDLGGSPPSTSA